MKMNFPKSLIILIIDLWLNIPQDWYTSVVTSAVIAPSLEKTTYKCFSENKQGWSQISSPTLLVSNLFIFRESCPATPDTTGYHQAFEVLPLFLFSLLRQFWESLLVYNNTLPSLYCFGMKRCLLSICPRIALYPIQITKWLPFWLWLLCFQSQGQDATLLITDWVDAIILLSIKHP